MPSSSDANPPSRRRSSLAKLGNTLSLQSKLAILRLNKSNANSQPDVLHQPGRNLDQAACRSSSAQQHSRAHLFVNLPAELLSQILLLLDHSSIFAFRLASVSFASIVSLHQYEIARHYLTAKAPRALYYNQPFTLYSIYHACHAQGVAARLGNTLADFVDSEILRLSSSRARSSFKSSRERFVSRMRPLLLALHLFFTRWRHWMLQNYPVDTQRGWPSYNNFSPYTQLGALQQLPNDETDGVTPVAFCKQLMTESFTPKRLCDASQMLQFLRQTLNRSLRAPSYATKVEKTLRGWNRKTSMVEYVDVLVAIGGLDEVQKLLACRSLSDRWDELERWVFSLQRSDCTSWRENWKGMVHGPCDDPDLEGNEANFDPPEYFSSHGFAEVWNMPFDLVVTGNSGKVFEPKPVRQFLSEMLGQDILAGTRWQTDFQFDDEDDDDRDPASLDDHLA